MKKEAVDRKKRQIEKAVERMSVLRRRHSAIQAAYECAIEKRDEETISNLEIELVALNGQIKGLSEFVKVWRSGLRRAGHLQLDWESWGADLTDPIDTTKE
jgi:hypothetical protein